MDARALALALALPLTARAATLIPARMCPAAPPYLQASASGRAMVSAFWVAENPMLSPRLPMQIPSMLTVRHRYLNLCTRQSRTLLLPATRREEAAFRWNINVFVCSVLIGVRILLYLADRLNVAEFLSQRIKFSEKVIAAAASSLVLGKALYTVGKETKQFSELLLYFLTLYNARFGALDASATADSSNGGASVSIGSSDAAVLLIEHDSDK